MSLCVLDIEPSIISTLALPATPPDMPMAHPREGRISLRVRSTFRRLKELHLKIAGLVKQRLPTCT